MLIFIPAINHYSLRRAIPFITLLQLLAHYFDQNIPRKNYQKSREVLSKPLPYLVTAYVFEK